VTYSDYGGEVCSVDGAAAEEPTREYERAHCIECNTDRVDRNVDETGVAGRLGGHDHTQCDQRQTSYLQI